MAILHNGITFEDVTRKTTVSLRCWRSGRDTKTTSAYRCGPCQPQKREVEVGDWGRQLVETWRRIVTADGRRIGRAYNLRTRIILRDNNTRSHLIN